jgi:hypothetical protein
LLGVALSCTVTVEVVGSIATATRMVFPVSTVDETLVRVLTPIPEVSDWASSLTGVQAMTATV